MKCKPTPKTHPNNPKENTRYKAMTRKVFSSKNVSPDRDDSSSRKTISTNRYMVLMVVAAAVCGVAVAEIWFVSLYTCSSLWASVFI